MNRSRSRRSSINTRWTVSALGCKRSGADVTGVTQAPTLGREMPASVSTELRVLLHIIDWPDFPPIRTMANHALSPNLALKVRKIQKSYNV